MQMGKFGKGVRVIDDEGDVGVIVGKRKGERDVKYETGPCAGKTVQNLRKGFFKLAPTTDAPAAQEQWVPKVGDRVRFKIDNPNGGSMYGKAGQEVTVTELSEFDDPTGLGKQVEISDTGCGWQPNAPLSALEPLPVAEQPAAEVELWAPVEGKFGKTRDGRKVGPMSKRQNAPESPYPWAGEASNGYRLIFKDDGENYDGPGSDNDLVAEWVEPAVAIPATPEPATTEAKFDVGDRVKIARNTRGDAHLNEAVGGEFTITTTDGHAGTKGWSGIPSESPYWWPEADLEYVIAPPSQPTPTPPTNFIVARLTTNGSPRPNARPRVHTSLEAAEAEAQRLADRLGDEFAVYQRVAVRDVDAGPVPGKWGDNFDAELARDWLKYGQGEHPRSPNAGMAFAWTEAPQGFSFWSSQCTTLTPLGRAILRKWIAEVEAGQGATTKEAA